MRVDLGSFDHRYSTEADPWAFASSPYELAKYDDTIAALSKPAYRRAFEPACSIGVLTERLARRCDAVVACDTSAHAIDLARARLRDASNVELAVGAVPEWWPTGSFDLVVLSELGYYWDAVGWSAVIDRVLDSLDTDAEIVAVHWLGSSHDHLTNGRDVHAALADRLGRPDAHLDAQGEVHSDSATAGFVLDRWSRVSRG